MGVRVNWNHPLCKSHLVQSIKQGRGSPTTPGPSTHSKTPKHPMQKHRADKHRKRRKRDKERQRKTQKHQTLRTHINQRDQWATGADLERPSATEIAESTLIHNVEQRVKVMAAGGDSVQEFPTQHVVECEDCGEQGDVKWFCKNCPGSLCDKSETRLNDYIKVLETDVCGKLKDMRIRIEEDISVGDKCSESLNKEIKTFEQEVVMVVHKSFQSLHKEVHGPRNDLTKSLADIDTQLKKVSEVIQECEKKIRIGNLDIIQFIPPDSESFIPNLNISAQVVPRFLPNRDILENIKLQLGRIEYASPVKRENDKEKERVVSLQVTIVSTFKSPFECTAISTIGDNKAWIIYQSSTSMRLYDCTGKFLKSFSVEKGKSITYMAMKRTGEMVISCSDKTIRLISNTGDCTKLIRTDPLSPAGICVTDSGDVMVCMRGKPEHRHLAIYSDDMMLKKSAMKSQYFTDPYRLLEIENMLYIINYCKNVVCLNVQGIMKWEYKGAKDMQLKTSFSARDISKDKYLNLLVVDCNNHCVHYINRDGQLIQIILTEGQTTLSYPWGISVDQETGLVWMGSCVRKDVCIASISE
ncbi:hypothetical protein FSP39_009327 [Pinctada imbricata]|uniref:Tripartite motif-containing protein 2 n=1 Tax=Pinctada imbricata TaxID=66713 RepID=A0AA88XUV9_PINIB|nr:hypothetical protein FSP39_009327 [Pinctada imbricata]